MVGRNLILTMAVATLLGAVGPRTFAAVDVSVSLQEAVKQGKVSVEVKSLGGATGKTIRVEVQRKVPEKVQVKVTPGTVFVAVGGTVQNMAGGTIKGEFIGGNRYRPGTSIVLQDDRKHSYLIESFCLDYHKPPPQRGHSFSLALHDERAKRIIDAPKDLQASPWAFQLALWMDRAGVSAEQVKRQFPRRVTEVDVRVAGKLLEHAEKTGVAQIPDGIAVDVRVQVEKLFSSNPAARAEALKKLGEMGQRAAPALPLVAVNVIDPRSGTTRVEVPSGRAEAGQWLESLGLASLAPVVDGLKLAGENGPIVTAETLEAVRDARVQRLTARLKSDNPRARQRAARTLGQIADVRAVPPLIDALADEDAGVQDEVVAALQKITGEDLGKQQAQWQAWWKQNKDRLLQAE